MRSPRALAALVRPIARRAGTKATASAIGRLALDWPMIVGPHWAAATRPETLLSPRSGGGAVLTVMVDPADALAVQHDLPRLLDRINRHFGHRVVARIKLRQAPVRRICPRRHPVALSLEDNNHIETLVSSVGDDTLRQRLAKIGRTLYASDRTTTTGK